MRARQLAPPSVAHLEGRSHAVEDYGRWCTNYQLLYPLQPRGRETQTFRQRGGEVLVPTPAQLHEAVDGTAVS